MLREDELRLSPEMAAAQEKLLAIRRALGVGQQEPARRDLAQQDLAGAAPVRSAAEPPVNWAQRNAIAELERRRRSAGFQTCSPAATEEARQCSAGFQTCSPTAAEDATPEEDARSESCAAVASSPCPSPQPPVPSAHIPAHPSLLLAFLRENREGAGRVWLLLRLVDADGRGWVTVDEARAALAEDGSPLRVCGWRRLRQLLGQGEGLFWSRDNDGRLWLRGAAKVAAALGVGRLRGAPVALPVAALTAGIRQTRAHFYAAFHSGREPSPISRAALAELSGKGARTQAAYEDTARVEVQTNLAVAGRYIKEEHQRQAWERGRSTFRFVDHKGRLGRPGGDYLAWRLPNSYAGPHDRRSRGGQKRLNRRLGDLVEKGIPGNDRHEAKERVFWPSGSKAARAFTSDQARDAYWLPSAGGSRAREQIWSVIAARRPDSSSRKHG